jgi:hypothetical protein
MNETTTNCPYCGADVMDSEIGNYWKCGSIFYPAYETYEGNLSRSERCHAFERANKAEAEVAGLSRELALWERGNYYKPKMLAKIHKLKANLRRAVEIADAFYEHDGTPWNTLRKELDEIKATLTETK